MANVNNIFVKVYGVNFELANNLALCKDLLFTLADKLGYKVLQTAFHQFKPYGLTGVLLLSESHLSLYTWPEENFAVIEMVTCKPFPENCKNIFLNQIKDTFQTGKLEVTITK